MAAQSTADDKKEAWREGGGLIAKIQPRWFALQLGGVSGCCAPPPPPATSSSQIHCETLLCAPVTSSERHAPQQQSSSSLCVSANAVRTSAAAAVSQAEQPCTTRHRTLLLLATHRSRERPTLVPNNKPDIDPAPPLHTTSSPPPVLSLPAIKATCKRGRPETRTALPTHSATPA